MKLAYNGLFWVHSLCLMIDRPPATPAHGTTINRLPTAEHGVCMSIFMCTCLAPQNAAYLPCSRSRRGPAELFPFQQKLWELSHRRLQSGLLYQPFSVSVWFCNCSYEKICNFLSAHRNNLYFLSKSTLGTWGNKRVAVGLQFKGALHWFHT